MKTHILTAFALAGTFFSAAAQMVTLNPGFETIATNYPGNASNWYGYTTGTGSYAAVSQWSNAVYAGTNGFLLEPHTQGTNDVGQAHLGSDLWAISANSTNDLSFELKAIGSTASSTWGTYQVGFWTAAFSNISYTPVQSFPYSWGVWTNVTFTNLVAPANASFIGVDFYAFAQDASAAGQSQWAVDNVFMTSVPEPSTCAMLVLTAAGLGAQVIRRRG